MIFEVLLWDLKGSVPSSIEVTTGYHSYIFRIDRSEVATWRLIIVDDLNLQWWSWSHKQESLCFFITSVGAYVVKAKEKSKDRKSVV